MRHRCSVCGNKNCCGDEMEVVIDELKAALNSETDRCIKCIERAKAALNSETDRCIKCIERAREEGVSDMRQVLAWIKLGA